MKGTSKVIMGATLVMLLSLAIVLALVLVLLAELYCTLLLRRRRQLRNNSSSAAPTATTSSTTPTATSTSTFSPITNNTSSSQPQHPQNQSPSPPPLTSFYAHGVIQAPRNLFFPAVKENKTQESNTNPHFINISPHQIQETQTQITKPNSSPADHFIYISNPIYDNDGNRPSRVLVDDTPYETPDSSPSRLETGTGSSSSGDEEEKDHEEITSSPLTPPLTPMKKLPAEASSVSLRDAKSLGTSSSSVSNDNGLSSSSSSGSPRTSPSW